MEYPGWGLGRGPSGGGGEQVAVQGGCGLHMTGIGGKLFFVDGGSTNTPPPLRCATPRTSRGCLGSALWLPGERLTHRFGPADRYIQNARPDGPAVQLMAEVPDRIER